MAEPSEPSEPIEPSEPVEPRAGRAPAFPAAPEGALALPPAPETTTELGIDIVRVSRIRGALDRFGERFVARVCTPREAAYVRGRPATLAGRWAAKEAVAKVLVDNRGLEWHDCEIVNGDLGEPILSLSGTVERAAQALGIEAWHLSLSHDGDMAIAFALATRGER